MFTDLAMITARQMGSYKAIAEMMADSIRELDTDCEFTREWAKRRLVSLADQLDETTQEYQKEVDSVA